MANIEHLLDDIRKDKYCVEMRETFCNALIETNKAAEEMESTVKKIKNEITSVNANAEVIDARCGEENLGDFNRKISSQLDKNVKKGYYGEKSNLSPYFKKSCAFAWVDDDGSKGFLTTLKPLLDARGMKCTLGVITDRVGTNTYLDKSELLELQENGYEIVSHTATHSSGIFKDNLAISETIIEDDLKRSQEWLFKNGFTGYDKLIFPWGNFGNYSIKYKSIARKFFKYACNALGSYNKTPVDNMYMDRYFIMKTMNIDSIKAKIDETIANNGLLIFGSHSYSSSEFNKEFFETVIDYVISKGYEITTS